MTTDTDKLIQVAEAAGFRVVRFNDADAYACDDEGKDITPKLAGFRTAIIASLCGDVEPVAWIESDKSGDKLGNTLIWYEINSRCEPLYPASALAALAAERDALRTALEDLTSEAVEIWEYPADYPQIEHANELIAKYKADDRKDYFDASVVAAITAQRDAALARVAELEKDAARYQWLRDGEIVADYPYPVMRMGGSRVDDQTIWADELDAAIDDAISAAQHPQQEQSK